jgi:hypothetical protein
MKKSMHNRGNSSDGEDATLRDGEDATLRDGEDATLRDGEDATLRDECVIEVSEWRT